MWRDYARRGHTHYGAKTRRGHLHTVECTQDKVYMQSDHGGNTQTKGSMRIVESRCGEYGLSHQAKHNAHVISVFWVCREGG